jgi:hypothetical protein
VSCRICRIRSLSLRIEYQSKHIIILDLAYIAESINGLAVQAGPSPKVTDHIPILKSHHPDQVLGVTVKVPSVHERKAMAGVGSIAALSSQPSLP